MGDGNRALVFLLLWLVGAGVELVCRCGEGRVLGCEGDARDGGGVQRACVGCMRYLMEGAVVVGARQMFMYSSSLVFRQNV